MFADAIRVPRAQIIHISSFHNTLVDDAIRVPRAQIKGLLEHTVAIGGMDAIRVPRAQTIPVF